MFDMMKMMGKFKEAQDKMKEIKTKTRNIASGSQKRDFLFKDAIM